MLKKAKGLLETYNASFVITGEILGQRPMSQRRESMNSIVRESGLKDILLRPLCARKLKETLPERMGFVDREALGCITGRGRKDQIMLAVKYGINKETIPTPAGGCLLTDEQISLKVKNTFERFHPAMPGKEDLILDIVGRKFCLDESTVLVVSRSEEENGILSTLISPGNIFVKIADVPGPLSIVRGNPTKDNMLKAAAICMRYGKGRGLNGQMALYGPDPYNFADCIESPVVTEEYCVTFQLDLNKGISL
ncbi:MAG TPA: tRNA 4-thiouridine(8) synthase ThiI [Deltaproteobacteria bacterium]|nr:tRNA 4-thiouridine(8) synthase ThiI [Deltaproteobacteria bacterium]